MPDRTFPTASSRLLPLALAATLALALAACGGSGGEDEHVEERIDSAGLLALGEAGSTALRLLDLDRDAVTHTLTLAAPPSALRASPGGRYALAVQRTQDRVQVIDGGLWQEDHVDHLHDYRREPSLLPQQISGPRPTHYEVDGGLGVFFMDGDAATQRGASVHTVTEASLARNGADSQFEAGPAVHGVAQPRGDYMLVSARSDSAPGTLPDVIDLYQREAQNWRLVQRLDGQCPDMHGSHSSAQFSVFGCSDGVLVVEQQGARFSTRKIANPPGLPEGSRIGTVAGHPRLARFIGLAGGSGVFDIDPAAGTIAPINWAEGRTRRAHSFDRSGRHFVLLDDTGTTHWLDSGAQWRVAARVPTMAAMPAAAPFPALVPGRARDEMLLTDPGAREIAVLDSAAPAVKRRIQLDFAPSVLAWLGIAAP